MVTKKQPERPNFSNIPLAPFTLKGPVTDYRQPLVVTKAVERLRRVGSLMLRRELMEEAHMHKERSRYADELLEQAETKLAMALAKGKLTPEEIKKIMDVIRSELFAVDAEVGAKITRQDSLVQKRAELLGPRTSKMVALALNDSFFSGLYRHDIFSEKMLRKFGDVKNYPVQTIAMVDVDNLKRFNQRFNHLRGGSVLLGAYAAAAEEICKKYGGDVVLSESVGVEGVKKLLSEEEYRKRLAEQGSPIAARYGSDEFTFHFNLPSKQVYAIMQEFMGLTSKHLFTGPLADVIKKSRSQKFFGKQYRGTATGAVVQVDFDFHTANGHKPDMIRKVLMNRVSGAMLDLKDQKKRGMLVEVKDDLTLEQIKRHRGVLGTIKHWLSFR
ncbi:MAG: hypothetical protein NUV57_05660 [archaeon]|nr:hypothetical protein [archaeon]